MKRNTVTVKMADGLGNQIFRYVCGYAIAKQNGADLVLDIADYTTDTYRSYQMELFEIDAHKIITFPNKTVVGKALRRIVRPIKYNVVNESELNPGSMSLDNLYLDGYFEDLQYFNLVESDIRRQLVPSYELPDDMKKVIAYCNNHNVCAIHMRLGDRRYDSSEYFRRAVNYINEKSADVEYILFSNEIEEAEKILEPTGIRYSVIDKYGDFTDVDSFFILQKCSKQILSVGTYGIWAGILNDDENKIVCIPNEIYDAKRYPVDWIRI